MTACVAGDSDGDDTIDGGADSDTLDFSAGTGSLTLNLAVTSAQALGGTYGSDTISNVENVTGTGQADVITGSSVANIINGGDSADTLEGGGGVDTLTGGSGADIFRYEALADGESVASGTGAGITGDSIIGFSTGVDKLFFDTNDFGNLSLGNLTDGVNFSVISTVYDGTNAGTNLEFDAGRDSFIFSTSDLRLV